MPHSTHEAEKMPDCGNGIKTDSSSAQGTSQRGGGSSQTTMLEIWANETEREKLPFSEVTQQPAVQPPARR